MFILKMLSFFSAFSLAPKKARFVQPLLNLWAHRSFPAMGTNGDKCRLLLIEDPALEPRVCFKTARGKVQVSVRREKEGGGGAEPVQEEVEGGGGSSWTTLCPTFNGPDQQCHTRPQLPCLTDLKNRTNTQTGSHFGQEEEKGFCESRGKRPSSHLLLCRQIDNGTSIRNQD